MADKRAKPQTPRLDLRKQFKELYSPSSRKVVVVDVPEFQYIWLDGTIEAGVSPSNSEAFREAMSAMYGVAYGLKFMSKLRETDPIDFTVMAMEGLWSTESGGEFDWEWSEPSLFSLLMMQPDHITKDMFDQVVEETGAKRPSAMLEEVRLEKWREGRAIQIMHLGPYSDEPATIEKMDAFAEEHGYQLHGRHHEIYIGDPTRAKPENLKTILRHPIRG